MGRRPYEDLCKYEGNLPASQAPARLPGTCPPPRRLPSACCPPATWILKGEKSWGGNPTGKSDGF